MNILRIIKKDFVLNLRDFKANAMMVLFPIVLIIILGAAFSGVFKQTIELGDVTVLYTVDIGKSGDQSFEKAFESFRETLTEELGISFEKTDDVEMGMESMNYYRYSAYLRISGNPREIKLYKNEKHNLTASLMESALNSFINTYQAMSAIAVNNPSALAMPELKERREFVNVRSLDEKKQAGSLDYYAVTMMTLILLYASMTGFWSIRSDIEQRTASRTLSAPVRKYEFLTGKVLGSIIITLIQALVVVLFSGLILKAYWGEDPVTVALLLLSYSIMTVSIGVGLAFIFKNSGAANGVLNSVIPFFVFLGGGYIPLSVMGSTFEKISVISPVKWINLALLGVIYDNDYSKVLISIGINVVIAAVFILMAVLISRKGTKSYA